MRKRMCSGRKKLKIGGIIVDGLYHVSSSPHVRDRETKGGRRTTAADVIDRINEEKNGEER